MRTVFLDTVGLLALWDESDQWHAAAAASMQTLLASPCRLVTSSFIMLECGNAAARTSHRSHVADFRDELERFGNLLVPDAEDELAAWEAYAAGGAGQAGIVDHVSFALMRRLKIREAFTNDRHFVAAGFEVLF